MKLLSIFFPGNYEDAYVYMGRLLAFTEERTVRVWNLEALVSGIQSTHPSVGTIPTLIFLRNDWLASEQFKALAQNAAVVRELLALAPHFPQPFFEVESANHMEYSLGAVRADSLLDVLIYYGRLYLSTETGLYQADIDWQSDATELGQVKRRWEARCINTSARLGAVNVSCGDDGLFSAIDEFGWLGQREPELRKTAAKSFKTLWFGNDLVNYRTFVEPDLLKNEYSRRHERSEATHDEPSEGLVVREIGRETLHLDGLFDGIWQKYRVGRDSAQFVYNSSSNFFVNTYDRGLFVAGLDRTNSYSKSKKPSVSFVRKFDSGMTHVYSATSTAAGVVLETDLSVQLFANGRWYPVLNAGVLSVRSFMRSRRYQNLVAATSEDGVFLTGIFNYGDE